MVIQLLCIIRPPVAQPDNAADSDSEDRRFESCQADQLIILYNFLIHIFCIDTKEVRKCVRMKRKIPTLIICDVFLALILFAKVNIRNSLLADIANTTSNTDVTNALCGNNWVAVAAMICISIIAGVMVLSKTKNISQLLADVVLVGLPGAILAIWWRVLAFTGWGYFISYQEMMAYIGSIMVGVCILKVLVYFFKKAD